ncbi:HAD-IB family hydrolase [Streptomyces argyrophyllae]|uniref:HAD-IB family hydrolase n=1 Tax=Streptomyces argyrophylli TaxID=2726118 RepID=A0A6M4PKD9_9ACTN|nr:HAD-IB family hydrolase [Streptomyces argyrophyllae]QJS11017.1 HAD-IB family hydrolase [Streptomyces argyrophyllae]
MTNRPDPHPLAADHDRPVVAFFDADETLIAMKTPFSLLRWRLRRQGDITGAAYERAVEPLRRLASMGVTPVEVVSKFYELHAGIPWGDVVAEARAWYADLREHGAPFIEPTVARLRRHQQAGHRTVVISGSWPATLHPITDDLGIDLVLCTEPDLDADGRMTGAIRHAMFGPAKADAVREALAKFGADPADCYAYGDDPGDLTMLGMVGHPTVVGANPRMTEHAAQHGWPTLPATLAAGTRRQHV